MKTSKFYVSEITLSILVFLFFSACRPSTNDIGNTFISLQGTSDISDLIKYQVKEEHFRNDSLNLVFKNVNWQEVSKENYELTISADYAKNAATYLANYYLIFSIYPLDEELHLLNEERKKYKFESFSMKMNSGEKSTMHLSRNVKTKIKSARAITISVLEYSTKLKSTEIVLQNSNQQKQMASK